MVFEHVEHPDESIRELVRITAPGGRILIHTVNSRHYLALVARLTPFRFHRWVVEKLEGRAGEDVYPTQYRVNTLRALTLAFERHGARRTWGSEVADLPVFVPYPLIFWAALLWGIVECHLGRLPWIRSFLRPNLLVEFTPVE
jgi:ubiquinone/menaquinone biosynthesis C-methylase UbiE